MPFLLLSSRGADLPARWLTPLLTTPIFHSALSHAHDLSALDALHRNISSGGTTGAGMVTRPVRDLQDDASLGKAPLAYFYSTSQSLSSLL